MRILPIAAVLAAAAAITACGTAPGVNSDVPNIVNLGLSHPSVLAPEGVTIVASGPLQTKTDQRVGGTSCKNKLWDPAPSEENAVALMKRQAAERGYNAVHSVSVEPDPTALAKNCWQAIRATGIAFTAFEADPTQE